MNIIKNVGDKILYFKDHKIFFIINQSPFDNEISILYKWSKVYGIPTKFILIRDEKLEKLVR